MMKVDAEFAELYGALVARALTEGRLRSARGKEHRALFNVVLETPATPVLMSTINRPFAIAELMAYAAGWNDVEWLARFNRNITQFSDNGLIFEGAYGERLAWSWETTIAKLRKDPDTRQAYVPIYWPQDVTSSSRDIPCNTSIQFQIVDGLLNATIYQRSCDLVWGLPYDHFSFAAIVYLVAFQLDLKPGRILRLIANAHVYTAKAGYASEKRAEKAAQDREAEVWIPQPLKFYAFRRAAEDARACIEANAISIHTSLESHELMRQLGTCG